LLLFVQKKAFDTGHFVALVHSKKVVVVAIRGTFHARDALTDLCAEYSPFLGGHAHAGIAEAATNKSEEILPVVLRALETHPDYRVVVTGHSLGAGTASLLAMLWKDAMNFPIECHAFACPPVLCVEMASLPETRAVINSYVANDDIIPRLSFGSMTDLKQWVVNLATDGTGYFHRMFQIMSLGNPLGDNATNFISKKMEWTPDLGASVRAALDHITPTERLYLPGKVYFLYKLRTLAEIESQPGFPNANPHASVEKSSDERQGDDIVGLTCEYDGIEESSPALFPDIVLSPSMLTDHMPDLYQEALEIALRRMVEEDEREVAIATAEAEAKPKAEAAGADNDEVNLIDLED
jgi:Lipase (class 3)